MTLIMQKRTVNDAVKYFPMTLCYDSYVALFTAEERRQLQMGAAIERNEGDINRIFIDMRKISKHILSQI